MVLPPLILTLVAEPEPAEGQVAFSWSGLMVTVAAAMAILSALAAGLVWIVKRIVRDEVAPVGRQLSTTNAKTVGQYIEDGAVDNAALLKMGKENRELIKNNQTLITHTAARLDEHIIKGHGPRGNK